MVQPQHTPGAAMRLFVLAVGFGGFIALLRFIAQGIAADGVFAIQDTAFAASSFTSILALSRIAILLVLAAAGWFRWFSLNRTVWLVLGLVELGSIGALSFVSGVFIPLLGVCIGLATGVAMYVWLMLLSTEPLQRLVQVSVLGLLFASLVIGFLQSAPFPVALSGVIALVFASFAVPFALDPSFETARCDGPLTRADIARAPWLPLFVFIVCGIFSTGLYSAASYTVSLFSNTSINTVAFGISAACGVLLTCGVMMQGENWPSAVWAPLFVLFLMADVFACFATHAALSLAVGLLLGCVFTFHFLRFVIFPAFLGQYELPRAFLSAIFLVFGNGFFASRIGEAIARAVPTGLRGMASIAGVCAVVLLALLGFAVLVFVMQNNATLTSAAEDTNDDVQSPEEAMAVRLQQLAVQFDLTQREIEVAQLSAQGFNASYISDRLAISQSTVRFHQQNVYRKLGIHSREELIELANLSPDTSE